MSGENISGENNVFDDNFGLFFFGSRGSGIPGVISERVGFVSVDSTVAIAGFDGEGQKTGQYDVRARLYG